MGQLQKSVGDFVSSLSKAYFVNSFYQTWGRLVQDYQSLNRQLEAVEGSVPSVGLVEETEERLMDRISLYQVQTDTGLDFRMWHSRLQLAPFQLRPHFSNVCFLLLLFLSV